MDGVRWSNVPVPEPHVAALAVGLALHVAFPRELPGTAWTRRIGGPGVLSAGVLITAWSIVAVRDVDVETPSQVVTRGPYALSRNPMYVGWTLTYLGLFLLLGSRWLMTLMPIVLVLTHRVVLQEERGLQKRFGYEYDLYRSRVRRYV